MNSITYALLILIVGFFLVALGATVRVCAEDARRRGKSPVLVTLLVILFFPLGTIIWLVFRPEPLDRGGPGKFHLEDHRVQ